MSKATVQRRNCIPAPPIPVSGLKDSGARVVSVTGALREAGDALVRGRYDLIPPECLSEMYGPEISKDLNFSEACDAMTNGLAYRCNGLAEFAYHMLCRAGSLSEGIRRLAVHYARGAVKYAARDWEKGKETGWLVDSMQRHLGQYQAGDQAEDHLAATVWNAFALMHHEARIRDGRLPKALDTYGLVK